MNKEALQVLSNRRSIRKYKTQQITDQELNAVLEAGTYAATGGGAQSPIIIVVQDAPTIKQLTRMNAAVMGKSDIDPYYGAPTILLVLAERGRNTYIEDGSCVLANLMNAAYAVGLGSCWINREKEMFDSPEGKALLEKWGIKGDYAGVGACLLGYADGPHPAPAPRKSNYIFKV